MLSKALKTILAGLCLLACDCAAQRGPFLSPVMIQQLHGANVILEGEGTLCSGVVVGEHRILTAAHCVEQCQIKAIVAHVNGAQVVAAPVKCDLDNDLAVLSTVDRLQGARWLASKALVVGDPVYLVGNPVFTSIISDYTTFGIVANTRQNMVMLTVLVRGGASGGAVYDLQGRVAGILVGSPVDRFGEPISGLAVAVGLAPIKAILE